MTTSSGTSKAVEGVVVSDGITPETRLSRWQQVSAWPIIVLSFAYIAAYVGPIYFYPLGRGLADAFHIAEYVIWAAFIVDYLVQFQLASDKKYFFKHEWLSLLIVVFPFLRPVRAIRGLIFIRQATTKKKSLVRSLPAILGSTAVLLVIIAGAAVLNAERSAPGATIKTPSDALWWSVTALTTSGGGNLGPVTVEGRLIATFLLVFGLGLLASMTGYVASWVLHEFNIAKEGERREAAQEAEAQLLAGVIESVAKFNAGKNFIVINQPRCRNWGCAVGVYFRKSRSFGPVRLNFSKHGLGASFGVKGLRAGKQAGRQGLYVRGGRAGLYGREHFG
jgi:voltage-gated potassium channel